MKKQFGFKVIWLLAAALLLLAVGCGADNSVEDPSQPDEVIQSVESAYIVGQWEVNDGRFGHRLFDFQEDGRLLLEDMDSGETIEMSYVFVEANTLIMSGYEEFNGSATVAFFDDKMDFTITFDGEIFAELYVFTRISQPTS
ncbi:MAG: hypothetical protein KC434_07940 [Anaerolineales bacterium]|nr:hypothetical protein [Anaerolineales bacterium]